MNWYCFSRWWKISIACFLRKIPMSSLESAINENHIIRCNKTQLIFFSASWRLICCCLWQNLFVLYRRKFQRNFLGQLLNYFEPIYQYLFTGWIQDIVKLMYIYKGFSWIDSFGDLSDKEKSLYQLEVCEDSDDMRI